MINVLIVDDHALVRFGIMQLLKDAQGMKSVGEASNGEDALRLVRELSPNMVLLDLKMPGMSGIEVTRRIISQNPEIKVIAITAFYDDPFPRRVLRAGASGYLTKDISLKGLIQAIRQVHAGKFYISPEIAQRLALVSITEGRDMASLFEALSERELQVMLMITSGFTVQEISERLCLSPKTVNSYRYRLFSKLKVKNDVELTHLAIKNGMLNKGELSENVA